MTYLNIFVPQINQFTKHLEKKNGSFMQNHTLECITGRKIVYALLNLRRKPSRVTCLAFTRSGRSLLQMFHTLCPRISQPVWLQPPLPHERTDGSYPRRVYPSSVQHHTKSTAKPSATWRAPKARPAFLLSFASLKLKIALPQMSFHQGLCFTDGCRE